jgi:hypothetical protein
MGLQSTLTLQCVISGGAITVATYYTQYAQPGGQIPNAAQEGSAQLSAGNNTILVPSGFTVQGVWVFAPTGSTNVKTFKGIAGDTGLSSTWGGVFGVTAGGSFVIQSTTSGETVTLIWF